MKDELHNLGQLNQEGWPACATHGVNKKYIHNLGQITSRHKLEYLRVHERILKCISETQGVHLIDVDQDTVQWQGSCGHGNEL